MRTLTDSDKARVRKRAALIFLTWLHAGHETKSATLKMHGALRRQGVPKASRPRNVAEFRACWQSVNAPRPEPLPEWLPGVKEKVEKSLDSIGKTL